MRQNRSVRRPLRETSCPICGDKLQARPGSIVITQNWLDCLRRCSKCEVGISNARKTPTIIFNDPRLNIPAEVRDGLLDTLALALNERNRENKKTKFGLSTSEDALTWTLFKFLSDSGQLTRVLRLAGLPIPDDVSRHEALLLWGVPVPLERDRNPTGWTLRRSVESISDRLDENQSSRTEPDVLIDFGACGLFIVEVKHTSGTSLQDVSYAGWDRYFPTDSLLSYAASMRSSSCYELARNWRFGIDLAATTERPFTLVYLGPDSLFLGDGERVLRPFEGCLPTEGLARFHKMCWNSLLAAIAGPPGWIVRHFEARGYSFDRGSA